MARDLNVKRRNLEQSIANEIAHEIYQALGPTMPEALAKNGDVVCEVFGRAFDRHGIINEASGARILAYVPKELAVRNLQFAEINRQLVAAVRPKAAFLSPVLRNSDCPAMLAATTCADRWAFFEN